MEQAYKQWHYVAAYMHSKQYAAQTYIQQSYVAAYTRSEQSNTNINKMNFYDSSHAF